jgi:hypothetical protein
MNSRTVDVNAFEKRPRAKETSKRKFKEDSFPITGVTCSDYFKEKK